jgi:hypothetical protein
MGCILDLLLFPVRLVMAFFFGSYYVVQELHYLQHRVQRVEEVLILLIERNDVEKSRQLAPKKPPPSPDQGGSSAAPLACCRVPDAYEIFLHHPRT